MKKTLLFAAGMALAAMPVVAQRLIAGYVAWPESGELPTYVQQWNGGNGTIQIDGKAWEDANFFISRVKPKVRFYDTRTQVYPSITQYDPVKKTGTDKRVCWWVPCGEPSFQGQTLNALADGVFDGEVFDMWSYIDHWGDWTSPYGWTPGNFADVAHKNGVGVSGTSQPAWANIGDWRGVYEKMVQVGGTATGKMLHYFGQDGLGYNSEWGGPGAKTLGLTTVHSDLQTYMQNVAKNPLWEVIWYAGTGDTGGNYFDSGISSFMEIYKSASIFLNYNWNNSSRMYNDIQLSKSAGKSPFYIYAGMNQQGGEPKGGSNYDLIKDFQYSIGLWGAHQRNMFWESRNANGSSDSQKMLTYLKYIHQWFGNGPLNPAIKKKIETVRNHRPYDNWAGLSSMMSARSTLNWDLTTEPFYTFFNIGNGTFFNWKGERQNDRCWHNIGVQDYQPTWHYWWAPTLMGGRESTLNASDLHMSSEITWEDAYVGGSCLKIGGTAATEYLHLFKSDFALVNGDYIVLKYKLLGGKANAKLVLYGKQTGTADEKANEFDIFSADECEDIEDASFNHGWQTARIAIKSGTRMSSWLLTALKFENAENLDLLLGGFWVEKKGTTFVTPAKPELKTAKIMANNTKGVDAKLIWNMANPMPAGQPCYNIDVNTSMFQLWSQQEGKEPVMAGLTTSWAGFVFAAPVDRAGQQKIRFGVSALSLDTENASDIAWSEYISMGEYQTVEEITINKNIIKPNEKFELSFIDPLHASATWTVLDQNNNVLWTGNGVTVECPGLPEIGAYNLKVASNGSTSEYPRYISISSESVGALPEIYSLAIDGNTVEEDDAALRIELNEPKTFSYTGRNADGSASRGVDINETWYGARVGDLGLKANSSFSLAGWVKYSDLPTGRSSFITIEDRINGGWPYNNWGYFWARINDEGKFLYDGVDTGWGWRAGSGTEGDRIFYRYDDARIDVNAWTHIALVFEYQPGTNKMRNAFYINGKKQVVSKYIAINKGTFEGLCGGDWMAFERGANNASKYSGTPTYEPDFCTQNYPLSDNMWICFGGTSQNITAAKGCVDDFSIWAKAMTDEDVLASMNGLDKNNLPAEVVGFWDFEQPANSDKSFPGYAGANATNKNPKSYLCSIPSEGENSNTRVYEEPSFLVGSPFISGTAFPVVTKPTWATRRAEVVGDGTGAEGEATITWTKPGDYEVELTLANGHGEAKMVYPVIKVGEEIQGLEGIEVDENGFYTYTIEDALFVEFDNDGAYDIEVYNMAGVLIGKKAVDVVAGQNASISLGNAGVYLVKVVRNGELLRTVKVVRK